MTDDDGATDTVTHDRDRGRQRQAPTAAFTLVGDDLAASFDGTGSTDSDGTIASYAWDFGDGDDRHRCQAEPHLRAAGNYTVKLTVTDNQGATDTVTKTVTSRLLRPVRWPQMRSPVRPAAAGAAPTTAARGPATAPRALLGGHGCRADEAHHGRTGPRIALESVSSTKTDVSVKVTMDKIAGGGGSFVSVGARTIGTNDYRAKVKVASNGALTLYLVKVVNNAETTLASTNSVGVQLHSGCDASNASAGNRYDADHDAGQGLEDQSDRARELAARHDRQRSVLQAAGGIGVVGYLSGSATGMPIVLRFDDLSAVTAQ